MKEWKKTRLGCVCKTNQQTYSSNEGWSFVNYLDTGNITENRVESIQHQRHYQVEQDERSG